ncbi:MAG TPA: DUF4097 family beta strand repeat-containing protein [Gemmatimonadales bacterium]|nr:DUF4097 family beta strand repeat-containing protein [Gemmatimonadales bacterium]
MRACSLALGALLLAPALAAQQASDLDFRRELAAGKRLFIQNIIGDIKVTGTSGRTVEVTGVRVRRRYGDPADVTLEVVELDNGVALCVRYPRNRGRRHESDRESKNPCSWSGDWNGNEDRNDTELNLTVKVPNDLLLRIGTVSGDVLAESLTGDLELKSVSGDVRLTGGKGPSIALETVSGDVELIDGRSPEVYGHTISGEVTFRGPILKDGSYEFATTSGNIDLTLPEQPDAKLTAATFSGRFSSDLPTTQNEQRRNRHRYNATWGNGSARLDLESLSGNIRIYVGTR